MVAAEDSEDKELEPETKRQRAEVRKRPAAMAPAAPRPRGQQNTARKAQTKGTAETEVKPQKAASKETKQRDAADGGLRGDPTLFCKGVLPGKAKGVPERRDKNVKRWADHVFLTADYTGATHTREHLEELGRAAFCAFNEADPEKFRGVAVKESHKDGSSHLQAAWLAGCYYDTRGILKRVRELDMQKRGWKTEPEREEK